MTNEVPDPKEKYAVDNRRPVLRTRSSKVVAICVAGALVLGGGVTATVLMVQNSTVDKAHSEEVASGKIYDVPKALQAELGWLKDIKVDPIAAQTDPSYYETWKAKLGIKTETVSQATAAQWHEYFETESGISQDVAKLAESQNKNLTAYVNAVAANRDTLTRSQLDTMRQEIAMHFVGQANPDQSWETTKTNSTIIPILENIAYKMKAGEVARVALEELDYHRAEGEGALVFSKFYSQKDGNAVGKDLAFTKTSIVGVNDAIANQKAFPAGTPPDAKAFFYE